MSIFGQPVWGTTIFIYIYTIIAIRVKINGGSRNFVEGGITKLKLKNFNEKRTWIYQVINQKKKKFTISFYKFSNFKLLHDSSL